MMIKVKGQVKSIVVLNEVNKGEREIYNTMANDSVKNIYMELEAVQYLIASYSNPVLKLDENFDGCDPDWHGSVEITSDIEVFVYADNPQLALDVMNFYYDDSFALDKAYVTMNGGEMLELDPQDSTFITWGSATIHSGEAPDNASIINADLHLNLIA